MSGCSPGVDYSPLLPAGHDLPPPPPRADTTLDPLQVQQATEDLISERNHLTAEAQTPPPAGSTGGKAPSAANARPAVTPVAARAAGTSQSAASGTAAAPQSNETK